MREQGMLEEIGTKVSTTRGASGADEWHDLIATVLASPNARRLAELGTSTTGQLLEMSEEEVSRWNLPAGTAAVVCWSDNDMYGQSRELRRLTREEADRVVSECSWSAIEEIVEHYTKEREDDGHPAHALYLLWRDAVPGTKGKIKRTPVRDRDTNLLLIPPDETSDEALAARRAQMDAMQMGIPPEQRQAVDRHNPPATCPRCHGRQERCPLGTPNWRLCTHAV